MVLSSEVTAGAPPTGADYHAAIGLPGLANLHSHAFQRGMAGLAETAGPTKDSFWTWRQVMYRFLDQLTPDDVEAIAAQLYVEMLEAGFTSRRRIPLSASRARWRLVRRSGRDGGAHRGGGSRERHRPDADAGVLRARRLRRPAGRRPAAPLRLDSSDISEAARGRRQAHRCPAARPPRHRAAFAARRDAGKPRRGHRTPSRMARSTFTSPSRRRRSRIAAPGPARRRSRGCSTTSRSTAAGASSTRRI